MIFVILISIVIGQISGDFVRDLKSKTSLEIQKQAAEDVINRLIPEFTDRLEIFIDPKLKTNTFKVSRNIINIYKCF